MFTSKTSLMMVFVISFVACNVFAYDYSVTAFQDVICNFNQQTHTATVTFPDYPITYSQIDLKLTLEEPTGLDGDEWDRTGRLYIFDDDGKRIEIARIITPYWNPTWTWTLDITELQNLFHGTRDVELWIESWKDDGYQATVWFELTEGTPAFLPVKTDNLWDGYACCYGSPGQYHLENFFVPITRPIAASTEKVLVRTSVTGHRFVDNSENGAEFLQRGRTVKVNNGGNWWNDLWQECGSWPVQPQDTGTWYYDRAGWCPGDLVDAWVLDVTSQITPGQDATIEYIPDEYINTGTAQDAAQWVGSQLIEMKVTDQLIVFNLSDLDVTAYDNEDLTVNSKTYDMKNFTASSINWTAVSDVNWLDVSQGSGSLAAAADTSVTVSYNSNANSLPAGSYVGTVTITDTTNGTADAVTANLKLYLTGNGGGTITREVWNNITGTEVVDLTGFANYPASPDTLTAITIFEGPTNAADNYGSRIHGYVEPMTTGSYTFWISSDDSSELWLSTDDNPANAVKIAEVVGYTGSRQWDKFTSQESVAQSLTGGQKYYIMALQKGGGGGDHIAVAWADPGIEQNVIHGSFLWPSGPAQPDTTPPTPDPMTFATAPHATGAVSISMTATTASDPSAVEYYFTCTAGGGNDSGWQGNSTYEDSGLAPAKMYTYTVQSRDKSPGQNATVASAEASARTFVDISVDNYSFELPGTTKQTNWTTVPGWNSDTVASDSGVETGWTPTEGSWTGFLMGPGPSVWNLTNHVIAAGKIITLKVDARQTGGGDDLQMSLYYDDNGSRISVASQTVLLSGSMAEFTLSFAADDIPASVGNRIGIELNNVSGPETWLGFDNVRLFYEQTIFYDGQMGVYDFVILAQQWLQTDCYYCNGADLSGDGQVNIDDLLILANNWINPE